MITEKSKDIRLQNPNIILFTVEWNT